MKHKKHLWLWGLSALMILLIWRNSAATGTESSSLSADVARFLLRYVSDAGFSVPFDTFHFYVRKLAHFSEYFALAVLITFSSWACPLIKRKRLQPLPFWIAVPCIDEAIQHFIPGRYGAFTDVAIDMSGFFCGMAAAYVLILIIRDIRSITAA